MAKNEPVLDEATAALRIRAMEMLDDLADAQVALDTLLLDKTELLDGAIHAEEAEQLSDLYDWHRSALMAIENEFNARLASIEEAYKPRQVEIEEEFAPKIEAANWRITNLEAEARALVLNVGRTVTGKALQAVWSKGRTTWDAGLLAGLALAIPQLEQCREVGEPTISIKRVKA
jgi:hypothetical protein